MLYTEIIAAVYDLHPNTCTLSEQNTALLQQALSERSKTPSVTAQKK
jgi:hypothetical protein